MAAALAAAVDRDEQKGLSVAEIQQQDMVKRYIVDFDSYFSRVYATSKEDAKAAIAACFPGEDYYSIREDDSVVHFSPSLLEKLGITPMNQEL